jgi:hypothetical protein
MPGEGFNFRDVGFRPLSSNQTPNLADEDKKSNKGSALHKEATKKLSKLRNKISTSQRKHSEAGQKDSRSNQLDNISVQEEGLDSAHRPSIDKSDVKRQAVRMSYDEESRTSEDYQHVSLVRDLRPATGKSTGVVQSPREDDTGSADAPRAVDTPGMLKDIPGLESDQMDTNRNFGPNLSQMLDVTQSTETAEATTQTHSGVNVTSGGSNNAIAKLNEDLKIEKADLQRKYSDLNKRYADLHNLCSETVAKYRKSEEDISVLQGQNRQLREDNEKLQIKAKATANQLKQSQTAVDKLTGFNEQFVEDIAALNSTIHDKDNQLEEKQTRYKEIQRKYHLASNELNKLKTESRSALPDSEIQKQWHDLDQDIKDWAVQNFSGQTNTTLDVLSPLRSTRVSPELLRLSGDCRTLLTSSKKRPLLAQAWVWYSLEHFVFDSNAVEHTGMWWAHDFREEIVRLDEYFRPSKFYHCNTCVHQKFNRLTRTTTYCFG